MEPFNWTCPHCNKPQVVTDNNYQSRWHPIYLRGVDIGNIGIRTVAIGCLNDSCRNLTLEVILTDRVRTSSGHDTAISDIRHWRLLPESNAVPQPDCIPPALRNDYYEACRIRDLSPKASATLSRRCLQGMIRDFTGIAMATLDAEIRELRKRVNDGTAPAGVTHETVDAIDRVRSIGNIAAHMEKDINLIIEIDEGEAVALTSLIELLFKEWYVARHERQQRLKQIEAIAEEKKAAIAQARGQIMEQKPGDEEKGRG